jgi:hypothetical protein
MKKRKKQIEAIKSQMTCPQGFDCTKPGSSACKQVETIETFLECLEANTNDCEFSLPIGPSNFCQCPLNLFTHNLQNQTAL